MRGQPEKDRIVRGSAQMDACKVILDVLEDILNFCGHFTDEIFSDGSANSITVFICYVLSDFM